MKKETRIIIQAVVNEENKTIEVAFKTEEEAEVVACFFAIGKAVLDLLTGIGGEEVGTEIFRDIIGRLETFCDEGETEEETATLEDFN